METNSKFRMLNWKLIQHFRSIEQQHRKIQSTKVSFNRKDMTDTHNACTCEPINSYNAPFRMQYSMENETQSHFRANQWNARTETVYLCLSMKKVLYRWSIAKELKQLMKNTRSERINVCCHQTIWFHWCSNKIKVWSVWSHIDHSHFGRSLSIHQGAVWRCYGSLKCTFLQSISTL